MGTEEVSEMLGLLGRDRRAELYDERPSQCGSKDDGAVKTTYGNGSSHCRPKIVESLADRYSHAVYRPDSDFVFILESESRCVPTS